MGKLQLNSVLSLAVFSAGFLFLMGWIVGTQSLWAIVFTGLIFGGLGGFIYDRFRNIGPAWMSALIGASIVFLAGAFQIIWIAWLAPLF